MHVAGVGCDCSGVTACNTPADNLASLIAVKCLQHIHTIKMLPPTCLAFHVSHSNRCSVKHAVHQHTANTADIAAARAGDFTRRPFAVAASMDSQQAPFSAASGLLLLLLLTLLV
jgi:hypothetical protein